MQVYLHQWVLGETKHLLKITPSCPIFVHWRPSSFLGKIKTVFMFVLGRSETWLSLFDSQDSTSAPFCNICWHHLTPFSLSQLRACACSCHRSVEHRSVPLAPSVLQNIQPALLWRTPVLFPTGIWTRWNEPWLQENWFWLKTWRNPWIQFWGRYWGEKQSRKEGELPGGLMACGNGFFVLLCFLLLTSNCGFLCTAALTSCLQKWEHCKSGNHRQFSHRMALK